MKYPWLEIAMKIQALAQSGLAYSKNEYDIERYEMIREIGSKIVADFSDTQMDKVENLFASDVGYATPKVEIRAIVFKENKVLMVREKADGKWALPGGWADVGLSPFEIAKKEVFEEAGIVVNPRRLLGVIDKSKHDFATSPYHIYQIYIECEYIEGEPTPGLETYDAEFVGKDHDKELSLHRTTKEMMDMAFKYHENPKATVFCD